MMIMKEKKCVIIKIMAAIALTLCLATYGNASADAATHLDTDSQELTIVAPGQTLGNEQQQEIETQESIEAKDEKTINKKKKEKTKKSEKASKQENLPVDTISNESIDTSGADVLTDTEETSIYGVDEVASIGICILLVLCAILSLMLLSRVRRVYERRKNRRKEEFLSPEDAPDRKGVEKDEQNRLDV